VSNPAAIARHAPTAAASPARPTGLRPAQIRAEAVIDTDAIAANTRLLLRTMHRHNPDAALMAVVKADGYGHGAVQSALAALRGGASSLGVATPTEALELRSAGIDAPVLAWLWPAGEDIAPALAANIDLGISSLDHLDAVLAAAGPSRPRIHLKIDTGLGRNGVGPADINSVIDATAAALRSGRVEVAGLMSHLASADVPGDPSVAEQTAAFRDVLMLAELAGIRGGTNHLANTPAVLSHPNTYFDLGRCGIGIYGINPLPPDDTVGPGLRPAMTLLGTVALTKRVPAGHGVSYGLTYRTAAETTLALVPLGYADGIPRAASSAGEVLLGGRRRRIAGRVAMDQVVVDCADDPVAAGDPVIVFGPGDQGEPTADDWAAACGTIGYEIVTRIGPRVPRRYVGTPDGQIGGVGVGGDSR
jgi:alanine racemase